MFVAICIGVGVVILSLLLAFSLQGAQFVATNNKAANDMLELITPNSRARVLDIGSGDGQLMVRFAKAGFTVDGVEINPWLVLRSRRTIARAGLGHKAAVQWGSFWRFDTSPYDIVLVYGIPHIMRRLEQKLDQEMQAGSKVVSNCFEFPGRHPIKSKGTVRLYEFEAKN